MITAFSPVVIQQSEFRSELAELMYIFDACEKALEADGVDDLWSAIEVLRSNNMKFQDYFNVELAYLSKLQDSPETATIRTDEETFERLEALYLLHAHFDVCATVISSLKSDDQQSTAEVFLGAAGRLYCLYDNQKNLNTRKEAA